MYARSINRAQGVVYSVLRTPPECLAEMFECCSCLELNLLASYNVINEILYGPL